MFSLNYQKKVVEVIDVCIIRQSICKMVPVTKSGPEGFLFICIGTLTLLGPSLSLKESVSVCQN